ncbi:hypothetical protein R3W88_030861 [Solanum pinnatisectum]|uniref:F-box family protein n=1 Tax=Solanum pinnatisectum TaxID=50273 RepID=A0AAV9LN12_9SOLN|nr:hypothetical protein R3W88_030861 [Solanum pinnatisectum]
MPLKLDEADCIKKVDDRLMSVLCIESDDDDVRGISNSYRWRQNGRGPRETLPFKRADGWMELKMGDFFNDAGEDGYVDARLMETKKLNEKGGLIVQGVEFRPE